MRDCKTNCQQKHKGNRISYSLCCKAFVALSESIIQTRCLLNRTTFLPARTVLDSCSQACSQPMQCFKQVSVKNWSKSFLIAGRNKPVFTDLSIWQVLNKSLRPNKLSIPKSVSFLLAPKACASQYFFA